MDVKFSRNLYEKGGYIWRTLEVKDAAQAVLH